MGINASAYIPGHRNLFGFHTDPSDHLARLVYIDIESARATAVGSDLGRGRITGATCVALNRGEAVAGKININPSNNQAHEFALTRPDGTSIDRDDLHREAHKLKRQ